MSTCPCHVIAKPQGLTRRSACADRVCETKLECEKDLSGLNLVYSTDNLNAKYKKMGQDYISKYQSALYNCKVSTILVLLGAVSKYASTLPQPTEDEVDAFFANIVLPLICYVEKSGLSPQQQQYEASIAGVLSLGMEYFLATSFVGIDFLVDSPVDVAKLNQAFKHMAQLAGCVVKPLPVLQPYVVA